MHELTTTVPDFFFWTLTLVLVLKLLTTGDRRWWVAIGACAGVASEAKWNIGFLVAALAVGFALTPARRLAASRWLALGAGDRRRAGRARPAVAGRERLARVRRVRRAPAERRAQPRRVPDRPGHLHRPGADPGLDRRAGLDAAEPGRAADSGAVGIASLIVLVLFLVMGGKPYYPGGIFTFLLAAGSVPLERWLARPPAAGPPHPARARHGRGHGPGRPDRAARRAAGPARPRAGHRPGSEDQLRPRREIAWPSLVGLVAREYHGLPPALRARTTLLTGNYGEAGAIERFGPADGLPTAYSGSQQLLALGPAASPRHRRHRGGHGPGSPAARVRARAADRHLRERPRRQRRRAGRRPSTWPPACARAGPGPGRAFRDYA